MVVTIDPDSWGDWDSVHTQFMAGAIYSTDPRHALELERRQWYVRVKLKHCEESLQALTVGDSGYVGFHIVSFLFKTQTPANLLPLICLLSHGFGSVPCLKG